MNLGKVFAHIGIAAIVALGIIIPIQASQLGPQAVIPAVHAGIHEVDNTDANPGLKWNVENGTASDCGRISGSLYCPRNNTIYITQEHIQMAYQYGDAALAYIVSHEYSHAVQTKAELDMSNITRVELQADCLAGYYMGVMPNVTFDLEDIQQIANQASAIGDYEFNNEQHHGTPEQRRNFVLRGFGSSQQKNGIRACEM
jgi:uncharacterized protein